MHSLEWYRKKLESCYIQNAKVQVALSLVIIISCFTYVAETYLAADDEVADDEDAHSQSSKKLLRIIDNGR